MKWKFGLQHRRDEGIQAGATPLYHGTHTQKSRRDERIQAGATPLYHGSHTQKSRRDDRLCALVPSPLRGFICW